MNVVYNKQSIGDVLIIPVQKEENANNISYEKHGDITKISTTKGELLGYNIFQASSHFNLTEKGNFILSEDLLNEIKQLFKSNKLTDELDFDLSPKFVVGYVEDKQSHEDAEKLSVCQVDVGDKKLQIVCGAANVAKWQKVVVAKVGATMPGGLEIKDAVLRGVSSSGMICSREELGLSKDQKEEGIYVLGDTYEVGDPFTSVHF